MIKIKNIKKILIGAFILFISLTLSNAASKTVLYDSQTGNITDLSTNGINNLSLRQTRNVTFKKLLSQFPAGHYWGKYVGSDTYYNSRQSVSLSTVTNLNFIRGYRTPSAVNIYDAKVLIGNPQIGGYPGTNSTPYTIELYWVFTNYFSSQHPITNLIPITFNGQWHTTIKPDTELWSDENGIFIPSNTTYYIAGYLELPTWGNGSNGNPGFMIEHNPQNEDIWFATAPHKWAKNLGSNVWATSGIKWDWMSTTSSPSIGGWGPLAIGGRQYPIRHTFGIIGSSTASGRHGGWTNGYEWYLDNINGLTMSLSNDYPCINFAAGGNTFDFALKQFDILKNATDLCTDIIIWNLGGNEISYSYSSDQIIGNAAELIKMFNELGKRVFITTIHPNYSAAGSPWTNADYIVNPTWLGTFTNFNNWVRTQQLATAIDWCAQWEYGSNTCKWNWKTNQDGTVVPLTSDGVHLYGATGGGGNNTNIWPIVFNFWESKLPVLVGD